MAQGQEGSVDFFISYNSADEAWAEWAAGVLEANSYKVILQKWDFRPGQNFVLQMHEAASSADRTILILSPNSIQSQFTGPEWAAAFVDDPQGSEAKLVPVRVAPCEVTGLLKAIVYIDLVERDEADAERELLQGVGSQRRKPQAKVPFPGSTTPAQPSSGPSLPPAAPASVDGPLWMPTTSRLESAWHRRSQSGYMSNHGTLLELHLVPATAQRLEVRRMATLSHDLIAAARGVDLFDNTSQIEPQTTSDLVIIEQVRSREREVAGIAVARTGDRSVWFGLPSDGLGAVFDPTYIVDRLVELIEMLAGLPIPVSDAYGLSAAVTSPILLTIGDLSVLGNRNSSTGIGISTSDVVIEADDIVTSANLQSRCDDVAQEVVARLEMALRDGR